MNRFFLSEDQVAFNVIGHQSATLNTPVLSSAMDKLVLADGANSQGGLALLIKKTSEASIITALTITTCDTVDGDFAAVDFQDSNVSILKEKLADVDQEKLFMLFGIKQDVLKQYFKVSITIDTSEAIEVIGLVAKAYGE
jgi:hypothetical protein